ncbi:MAG: hypothetical protein H0V43_12425 [Gemmatimonadales bacterium]|nr:hypothetical protein [Gemmatimonadales bacterium]
MLTPQSRALFAAAYSALLLTSERDEANQVPGAAAAGRPDSGDANSRPEPEPADRAAAAPVTDVIADPEGRA